MIEISPGLWHWTTPYSKIGFEVSSYFIADSGTLLDPMVPPDGGGLDWFRDGHEPQAIVLTNRHHDRESARFVDEFGIGPVLVPESGLHEFEDKHLDIRAYMPGEEVAAGVVVHEVGAICPDDMALEIRSAGALAVADALVHFSDGLRFAPDTYMDDPAATKRALVQSLERLLAIDFDTLLFAHGEPLVGGAKQALRDFLASDPAS